MARPPGPSGGRMREREPHVLAAGACQPMTPRELVLAALHHQETPQVPYNCMLSPLAEERLRAYYRTTDLLDSLGLHLYLFGCVGKPLYAHPDQYGPTISDEFGVVWATSAVDRGYPVAHPLSRPSLASYSFPDPLDPARWQGVAQAASRYPHKFRLAVVGDLWERAHFLRGLQPLLMDLTDHPAFVHQLLDLLCEYNLATLERLAEYGPDGVFISDDYGFQDRLMLRPEQWREFVQPRLRRLVAAAHRRGLVAMLHSCGNLTAIMPDLVETGLDILHPIQPEAMDIMWLKREYGRDLTFCGGISTQRLLPFSSPDQVRAQVRRTITQMSAGGGYITEPGITVQADVPVENIVAFLEEARQYRRP